MRRLQSVIGVVWTLVVLVYGPLGPGQMMVAGATEGDASTTNAETGETRS
jgi:hypothetical protein